MLSLRIKRRRNLFFYVIGLALFVVSWHYAAQPDSHFHVEPTAVVLPWEHKVDLASFEIDQADIVRNISLGRNIALGNKEPTKIDVNQKFAQTEINKEMPILKADGVHQEIPGNEIKMELLQDIVIENNKEIKERVEIDEPAMQLPLALQNPKEVKKGGEIDPWKLPLQKVFMI